MTDPARKPPLSRERFEQLARTADYYIYYVHTPDTGRMSIIEWGVVFAASTITYLLMDVILPDRLIPEKLHWITPIAFLAMVLTGVRLLIFAGAWARHRFFPRQPRVACPGCATRSVLKRYLSGQGCRKCGSTSVPCARCGKPAEVMQFMSGAGCPHCKYKKFHVYR